MMAVQGGGNISGWALNAAGIGGHRNERLEEQQAAADSNG